MWSQTALDILLPSTYSAFSPSLTWFVIKIDPSTSRKTRQNWSTLAYKHTHTHTHTHTHVRYNSACTACMQWPHFGHSSYSRASARTVRALHAHASTGVWIMAIELHTSERVLVYKSMIMALTCTIFHPSGTTRYEPRPSDGASSWLQVVVFVFVLFCFVFVLFCFSVCNKMCTLGSVA